MRIVSILYQLGQSEQVQPFNNLLYRTFMPSLDTKGTAIREYLFRKHRIAEPSVFFKDFSDADLHTVLEELQQLALKVRYSERLTEEEVVLYAAFRRSVRKLVRMDQRIV